MKHDNTNILDNILTTKPNISNPETKEEVKLAETTNKAITSDWDIKPEPMTIKSILEEGSFSSSTEILRHYYLTLIENKISVKAVELANIQKLITFLTNIKGPTPP